MSQEQGNANNEMDLEDQYSGGNSGRIFVARTLKELEAYINEPMTTQMQIFEVWRKNSKRKWMSQ